MADEEKYRLEEPDEKKDVEEKKGLFRPLPTVEEKKGITKKGKPQPIVKFFGFSMYESRRELLVLFLVPFLSAIIDVTIYSFVTVSIWSNNATYLFFLPVLAAIPIGLTLSETGRALIGAFVCSLFFLVLFIIFLTTPALLSPQLGLGSFLVSGITLSVGYFIMILVASLLGSVAGTLIREFM